MNSNHKNLLLFAFGLAILLGLGWYLSSQGEFLASLSVSSPQSLLPMLAFLLVSVFLSGQFMASVIIPLGVKLDFFEAFGLSAISRFANYLTAKIAGAAVRSTYLKKKHGLRYSQFTSSFAVSNVIVLLVSVIPLVFYLAVLATDSDSHLGVIVVIIGVALPILGFLLIPWPAAIRKLNISSPIAKFVQAFYQGWQSIQKSYRTLVLCAVWASGMLLCSAVLMMFEFQFFGEELRFIDALIISAVLRLSVVLSITPGGIGITEGAAVFGAGMLGVPLETAFAASLLRRILDITLSGVLCLFLVPALMGESFPDWLARR